MSKFTLIEDATIAARAELLRIAEDAVPRYDALSPLTPMQYAAMRREYLEAVRRVLDDAEFGLLDGKPTLRFKEPTD